MGLSVTEITNQYIEAFPEDVTRSQIDRAITATQTTVVRQNATALGVDPQVIRDATGPFDRTEDISDEIALGLERMLMMWQLDYSRLTIEPQFRADQVDFVLNLVLGGTTRQALVLLSLEAIRRPEYGAEASNSLIDFPPTYDEIREANRLADLAEAALIVDDPTPEMLQAAEDITHREVFRPVQRRTRATDATTRLSRRTITQTQGTTAKEVQTSMGITGYLWVSQRDSRVRELHRQFDRASQNGEVYTWARGTGVPGNENPGDAYGCRCVAVPVVNGVAAFVP